MNKPKGNNVLSKITRSILLVLLSVLLLLAVFAWDMPASEASNESDADAQDNRHAAEDISDDTLEKLSASDILCRDQNYSEEEIIIKFKSHVSDKSADMMLGSLGSELDTEPLLGDYVVAEVPEGITVEEFIDEVSELSEVEYVQPNYLYQLNRTVNDPAMSQQWHLSHINVFDAWDMTMGDAGIKVAVIDSCVETSHPDLSSQIIATWNAVEGGSDAPDNHGTHVAGIIAAQANNGIGVAGVAPGIKLITINVFSGTPATATTSNVIKGIRYAVSSGARVINLSLGGYGYDGVLEGEINAAVQSNVVVVAAAGNGNTSSYSSPSDYNSVISVIATDQSNQKASFSDYGPYKDISAPGVSIYSTVTGGSYNHMQGTSMSSPVVAGVAALILSVNPALTVSEVKHILYNTATDVNTPGWDALTGHGVVNAKAAVFAALKPSLSVSFADTGAVGLVFSQITHAAGYEIFRAPSGSGDFAHIATVSGVLSWTDSGLASGTGYSYKIRAYYTEGAKTIYGAFSQAVSTTTVYIPAPPPATTPPPAPAPPPHVGTFVAKRIPSKAFAGTAINILPPAAPRNYTMQSVSYSSNRPSVATVDANGNVTFIGGGKATIIIKAISQTIDRRGRVRTKTSTIKKNITVNQPVESISLNTADTTIARRQKVRLTPVFAPATASNKKLKWITSNKKVATVSSSGVVTGRAGGTAVITCRAQDGSGASASCSVTVTPIHPTGLRLSQSALTIKAGKTSSLKATVAPKNTDFKTVTWTSSNPAIAVVDARGRVRGAAPGTVTITATTSNDLSASCAVTIV